jgi:glucose/arabinose dehydrogenase
VSESLSVEEKPVPPVRVLLRSALVTLALACAATVPARATVVPDGFHDDLIAYGFGSLSNFDFLPDRRVLVIEQLTARIYLVDPTGVLPPDTVGVVPDVQVGGGEAGLLGIAVDPRWPSKPYIYVDYSSITSPNLHLTRFALTGDLDGTQDGGLDLDVSSRRDILVDLPDDFSQHNGGTLRFAPDGMLWVSTGDDNVPCSAQDLHELRGKLLRLSVLGLPDGPGWAPTYQEITPPDNPLVSPDPRTGLIWAYGLRNPWTFDFDPTSGVVAIADVGEHDFEEIDVVTQGGRNFGWPLYEGPYRFDYPLCVYTDTLTLVAPSYAYPHQGPSAIVMGGIAYFDPAALANFPAAYMGNVFFTDLYDGRIRRLVCTGGTCTIAPPVPGQPDSTAWATGLDGPTRMRFGPDAGLWYVTYSGVIRRIRADLLLAVDPPGAASSLALRAYPVPSAGSTRLSFSLPAAGRVSLVVTDARGRRVRTLVPAGPAADGDHFAAWDGRDDQGARVAPGVYFGSLRAGDRTETKRLILLGSR